MCPLAGRDKGSGEKKTEKWQRGGGTAATGRGGRGASLSAGGRRTEQRQSQTPLEEGK